MEGRDSSLWQAPQPPDWLARMNAEGDCFDLAAVVPLDAQSLLDHARRVTGLDDFGDELWREPFAVYIRALEEEARLTLMGRLMARNDILLWLATRLRVVDALRRHPEILQQPVPAPMFVVGLPRSGTSILYELLAQDPAAGVPLMWEALQPCPPPEAATYASDPRIDVAHRLFTQWSRVAPEFAGMHEMRGDIPAECGLLMAPTFVSDHNASLHQTPSYSAWLAQADFLPVYRYHRQVLQILQWKNPRQRWLLKAPEHQVHLETLLAVYPDARIVQTHRDPIKCMASATSLMGTLYSMRSEQPFNAAMFENIIMGEATANRLEAVMALRETGVVPAQNITDSRYQDLMDDPLACIESIYAHFDMALSAQARKRMLAYLQEKPRGKFGAHRYTVGPERAAERALFRRYQERYNVPDEA
ncbi:MAG: sulfotransferase family protein [Halioglobus sp.]|nr:sulfotransferase family protein [Halioglobus sp.]|tara:strand:+ start:2674 stop:3927 length:1254 start_codon:yes stop_codon:yes gene_type:complete